MLPETEFASLFVGHRQLQEASGQPGHNGQRCAPRLARYVCAPGLKRNMRDAVRFPIVYQDVEGSSRLRSMGHWCNGSVRSLKSEERRANWQDIRISTVHFADITSLPDLKGGSASFDMRTSTRTALPSNSELPDFCMGRHCSLAPLAAQDTEVSAVNMDVHRLACRVLNSGVIESL